MKEETELTDGKPRLSTVFQKMRLTAITFIENFILIGEGNNLTFFQNINSNWQIIKKEKILENSIIHGICPKLVVRRPERLKTPKNCDKEHLHFTLAIYGAKEFHIFSSVIKGDSVENNVSAVNHLDDWIWDVKWIEDNPETETLALALAHNSVVLWDCKFNVVIKKIQSSELSLLYSACLIGSTWNNLLVAAGTVYQDILLWSPVPDLNNPNGRVMHRLTGHQGVIFSIKFNFALKLLCSTSDDRTIRVWKFNCLLKCSEEEFSLQAWSEGSFSPIHTFYGHESRVWQSEILTRKSLLVSIGEDSNICVWNYQDGSLVETKTLSCGGLWSMAVNDDETLIALGGGDGSLALLDMSKKSLTLDEICLPLPPMCFENDFFRDIALIQSFRDTKIIGTTNNGLVLTYNISTEEWTKIHQDPMLNNFSLLSVSDQKRPESPCVAIGTLSGTVLLFSENLSTPYKLIAYKGKIHSLFWVKNVDVNTLMITGPQGSVSLWKVEISDSKVNVEQLCEIFLPECKQRFPSAVLTLLDNTYCLLGDRMGGLHSYKVKPVSLDKLPFHSLPSFHGKNGVTDICEVEELIWTTGRDGQIATFQFSDTNGLILLYSFKVPGSKLEWIGGILPSLTESSEILLSGFHTTKFVLWSPKKECNLLELHCGGGHRSWDVALLAKDFPFIFTCIRKNKIMIWTSNKDINSDSFVELKPGFHTSKIWSATLLFSNENNFFVATGGEDNIILISKICNNLEKSNSTLTKSLCLSSHISIVRALATTALPGNKKCLLLSAGGQSQFIVWEIWLNTSSLSIGHCRLANHFLREDQSPSECIKGKNLTDIHRMRYMDAHIRKSHNRDDLYDITLACSDSKIRIFSFDYLSRKVNLISSISNGNSCIFRLNFLNEYILSGNGNGVVCIFNPSENNFRNHLSLNLHEAGINSMAILELNDDLWFCCTGGDDNKIVANVLSTSNSTISVTANEVVSGHSAQISGLYLNRSTQIEGYLCSVSIDQRINIWDWKLEDVVSNGLEIILKQSLSVFSHVADIAGCVVTSIDYKDKTILVYGSGVELFKEINNS